MITECPECKRQVSNHADTCPNCGNPLRKVAPQLSSARRSAPVFLALAIVSLVLLLCTPRLLLFFPMMVTLACGVVSLVRRERGLALAPFVLIFAVWLWIIAEHGGGTPGLVSGTNRQSESEPSAVGPQSFNLAAAELEDWNWRSEPDFGTRGTVRWNVKVKNTTEKPISSVKVELTTYSADGKMLASTFTYVDAIPPGGSRAEESYADYYGTEKTAEAKIVDVRFAH